MKGEAAIRLAAPSDAQAIAAVHVASWRTTYPGIVAQSYIDSLAVDDRRVVWDRRIRGEAAGVSDTIVAELATGDVVGFACGGEIREPHPGFDSELYAIYLMDSAQRSGIGRQLTREWAKLAVTRGFRAAVVRVLALNPARLFYERLGARQIKRGELTIGGQPYPELWYGWDDLRSLTD